MSPSPQVTAIVPTLGASPFLAECLTSLRAQEPSPEIVLVDQGESALELPARLRDPRLRILRPGRNLGFAGGANLGIAASAGSFLATVNDDAVLAPGWLRGLVGALESAPAAAAAQGVNLRMGEHGLADGCGLAWTPRWQAVQIGHGRPAPSPDAPAREVFGVSATAALYRRAALTAAARETGGAVFDSRLHSYYEDVELACRLRAAGQSALCVPFARARHAGSESGKRSRRWLSSQIHGNRLLVLARLLGSSFWPRLPLFIARDVTDFANLSVRGDLARAAGVVSGWGRAAMLLPRFARRGQPSVALAEIRRLAPPEAV